MRTRDDIIQVLSDMIRFDTSINPDFNVFPNRDCANFVEEFGRNNGFQVLDLGECWYDETKQHPIYPSVLYKKGEKLGPTILFLGHIDVVPVSDGERPSWTNKPFEPHVESDYVMGRGASDMKGGNTAFLVAFKNHEVKVGNLVIAFSGDEEIGGTASMPLIVKKLRENDLYPDFVINAEPSSPPIIVTKRRGGTWLNFSFPLTQNTTRGEAKSRTFHSIMGNGSESLHSSNYVLGADIHATIAAAKFGVDKKIQYFYSSSIKTNSVPKYVEVTYIAENEASDSEVNYSPDLTKIITALASIGSLHWPIVQSKYGPSICPNIFKYEPDKLTITFDIRAMYRDKNSHDELLNMISEHFKSYGLEPIAEIKVAIDTVNVDPDGYLASVVKSEANKVGLEIIDIGEKLGGASDTRFFTINGTPGVELGPIGEGAHGTNEAVRISSLEKLVVIFQNLFETLINKT